MIDPKRLTFPRGMDMRGVERIIQEAEKDLQKLDSDFERHLTRRSSHRLPMSVFDSVSRFVQYDSNDMIDVSPLAIGIHDEDKKVFNDVCIFAFQYVQGKPRTDRTLNIFRSLLVRYLVKAGF